MNTGLASAHDEIATAKEPLSDKCSRASTILLRHVALTDLACLAFYALEFVSPHLEQSLPFKDEDNGGLGQRKHVRRVQASSSPIWHIASL